MKQGADVNARDFVQETPLHNVVNIQINSTIVKLLHGAEVNAKNHFSLTPLHKAVEEESLEIVNLLLSYGANINAEDNEGNTHLISTVDEDYKAIFLKFLIKKGADLENARLCQIFIKKRCYF